MGEALEEFSTFTNATSPRLRTIGTAYSNPWWEVLHIFPPERCSAVFSAGSVVFGIKNAEKLLNLWVRISSLNNEIRARRGSFRADLAESNSREAQALSAQLRLADRLDNLLKEMPPGARAQAMRSLEEFDAALDALTTKDIVNSLPLVPSNTTHTPVIATLDKASTDELRIASSSAARSASRFISD